VTEEPPFEFPPKQAAVYRKARRLEWLSLGYIASAVVVLYFVMGTSQAMRTTWMEDLISLVPPAAFLIGSHIALRRPTAEHPYGYHAAVSIAYLTAALALLTMGAILLIEAVEKLARAERPTIGGFVIFGEVIWAGWPMLAGLAYTGIPSFFLGRAKLRLAAQIHDKALHADADMNRADWIAQGATAIAVLAAGFGFWWADATAAAIVSLDILYDGWRNVSAAVNDLIARIPWKVDRSGPEPWPRRVRAHLEALPWVEAARVRMREQGHVFFVEAFVVPKSPEGLLENIAAARQEIEGMTWRLHDITITTVSSVAEAEARTPDSSDNLQAQTIRCSEHVPGAN
jgi:divalent metal cation (Fe/Co/Zn/Cd) transporter